MALLLPLASEPAYCKTSTLTNTKFLSPSQWLACFRYGLHEPASPAVTHAGYLTGQSIIPVLIGLAVLYVIFKKATKSKVIKTTSFRKGQ